ncbi:MAG: dTDP-4-dehydrorhamnose 3,5-epimerase [Flammeovirgaceae bacterium]|nr:MAG: dTDP-4-dehydrorhamnose 3,5-epimerase [Flammeovirgaceae bacterium]
MQIIETEIGGLLEIIPVVYTDNRGWFYEFFKKNEFAKAGITYAFTQENISFSKKGVVRGLHFQVAPYQQVKLVSVLQGKVLDVAVDLRKGSSTFGKWHTCVLDSDKHNMVLVPEGFAHGFAALEDSLFIYKSTSVYQPSAEAGIIWNDPQLGIPWPFADPTLSAKDSNLPTLDELLRKSVISRD